MISINAPISISDVAILILLLAKKKYYAQRVEIEAKRSDRPSE